MASSTAVPRTHAIGGGSPQTLGSANKSVLNSLPWLNSPDFARTALDRAKQPTMGFRRTQPNWTRKPLTNEGLRRLGLLHGSETTAGSSVALTSFGVRGGRQLVREAWFPSAFVRGTGSQEERRLPLASFSSPRHGPASNQRPERSPRMASLPICSLGSPCASQSLAPKPRALPNNSVEPTSNGMGAQPVSGQWHHPLPCRAPMPLVAAHLKR